MTTSINPTSQEINAWLAKSTHSMEGIEAAEKKADSQLNVSKHTSLPNVITSAANLAHGFIYGASMAGTFVVGVMGTARGFWGSKSVKPMNDSLGGHGTLEHAFEAANANTDYGTALLCRQKAVAVQIERSWLMMGLGACLMVVGVVGNAIAPGASNVLVGVGASMVFGAPFVDGYVAPKNK